MARFTGIDRKPGRKKVSNNKITIQKEAQVIIKYTKSNLIDLLNSFIFSDFSILVAASKLKT